MLLFKQPVCASFALRLQLFKQLVCVCVGCFTVKDRQVEMNNQHLSGQCIGMCMYVAQWAGGKDPIFLRELDLWSKTVTNRREISSKQFGMLAKAELSWVAYGINYESLESPRSISANIC